MFDTNDGRPRTPIERALEPWTHTTETPPALLEALRRRRRARRTRHASALAMVVVAASAVCIVRPGPQGGEPPNGPGPVRTAERAHGVSDSAFELRLINRAFEPGALVLPVRAGGPVGEPWRAFDQRQIEGVLAAL